MSDSNKLPVYIDYTTGQEAPFHERELFPNNPQAAAVAAISAVAIAAIAAITCLSLPQVTSSESNRDTTHQAASSNKK